jgi:hypothetical protein
LSKDRPFLGNVQRKEQPFDKGMMSFANTPSPEEEGVWVFASDIIPFDKLRTGGVRYIRQHEVADVLRST